MVKLFFSYSHKDEDYLNQIQNHLSILRNNGTIETWYDRRIEAGKEIDPEIDGHLLESDIILLLISSDFIASDYCYKNEMQKALEMHEKGEARIIPIILRPCGWKESPFKNLKALPTDGKAIIKYPVPDEAYEEITAEISSIASKIASKKINVPTKTAVPEKRKDQEKKQNILAGSNININIRSSNLRIKQEFPDIERDNFLYGAFEYIKKYFDGSLDELKSRNHDIEGILREIDKNRFAVTIYRKGKIKNQCTIYLKRDGSFGSGIYYSLDDMGNSFNTYLTVENDDYSLYLNSIGYVSHIQYGKNEKLSYEGGAELLWSIFIEPLQH